MSLNKYDVLKKKIYLIIFRSDTPNGKLFDLILLWMILFSILTVALESVASIRNQYLQYIHIAEWIFTIAFSTEYALRIYSSRKPAQYIFSFYGIIDLISFLPTYISLLLAGSQYLIVVRAFRLLRVFRILKLNRYMSEGNILKTALYSSKYKIIVFISSVLTVVTIVGTLMYIIEGDASGFTSIPVAIYWSIVTITTVGYGDISPQTPFGQFVASALMIVGYGIIAIPTGIVSVELARATNDTLEKCPACKSSIQPKNAQYCSNCGKEISKEKDGGRINGE